MKIKQLDVKGFRSLKDVSWRPGDLNVVIGQNGTGKSNLLRMLELISVAAQGQGKLSKYIQNAGGMTPILWDGRAPSINFHLKMDDPLETQVVPNDYAVELVRLGDTGWYQVEREILTDGASTKYIERNGDARAVLGGINTAWVGSSGPSAQETLLSLVTQSLTSKLPSEYAQTLRFRERLAEIAVYHDLNVGQGSQIRQADIARFEKRLDPDGRNLASVLHTLYSNDREFESDIDSAMRAAFGDAYEKLYFPPAADQRIQLGMRWKSLQRRQSAADLSDGTLRFLLLLTALAAPDPPTLIAIDEPETGLHPAMMNIIAEYAVEAAMRTQLVFTTHSAQFLDAFTENKPTTTVATWENGETSLHTLEGEALDYWLKDYSLGALFESGQLEAMT